MVFLCVLVSSWWSRRRCPGAGLLRHLETEPRRQPDHQGTGITGLGAGGAPPTLYVSQAANGTVVVGSDINESGAKLYQVGPNGLTLEREGTSEHLSVSADSKTLTVRITRPLPPPARSCIRERPTWTPVNAGPPGVSGSAVISPSHAPGVSLVTLIARE